MFLLAQWCCTVCLAPFYFIVHVTCYKDNKSLFYSTVDKTYSIGLMSGHSKWNTDDIEMATRCFVTHVVIRIRCPWAIRVISVNFLHLEITKWGARWEVTRALQLGTVNLCTSHWNKASHIHLQVEQQLRKWSHPEGDSGSSHIYDPQPQHWLPTGLRVESPAVTLSTHTTHSVFLHLSVQRNTKTADRWIDPARGGSSTCMEEYWVS